MNSLPYHIRRRQRRFVLSLGALSVGFFFLSIGMIWMAAGMMIDSNRFCEVMMSCYTAKISQYQHHSPPPDPKLLKAITKK